MSAVNMTQEQRAAVEARGKVIVSASAGSGKTFVMIERLVALILGGEDVRRILAVTFTEKAAAQMRERLRGALVKGIASRTGEERRRLKDQLAALPLAEISTIHAFCGRLVRTYFYAAGVDPAFRIAGAGPEAEEISRRALDAVFERAYAQKEEDFSRLLEVWFIKRKDARLKEFVLKLHAKVRGMADYRRLLSDMGSSDLFLKACDVVVDDFRLRADMVLSSLAECRHGALVLGEKMAAYTEALAAFLTDLRGKKELYGMRAAAEGVKGLPRRPTVKAASCEEQEAADAVGEVRTAIAKLCKDLSALPSREEEEARCKDAASLAVALARLTLAYDEEYAREKAEAGVLDYDDLEHFALRVLADEDIRRDVSARFSAVFVDEYQDVNPVQEELLSRIGCADVFLVGDAKQAIYGFRGSRSEFFEEKARTLPVSRQLSANFRSAPAVLDAVNRVFSPLVEGYVPMRGGERYGDHTGEVLFHVLPAEEEAPPREEVYSVLAHADDVQHDAFGEKVAQLVEEELQKTWFDADEGVEKRVTFGDIAILTRRKSKEATIVSRALAERGIPVTSAAEVNLCDFFETRLLLDWLSFLDEPEQDVPFTTALLSAVGGLTEAELVRVRLAPEGRGGSFRAACARFCEKYPASPVAKKIAALLRTAEEVRVHACIRTAAEVMNELLSLGLEAQIAAKGGASERLARVRRLVAEGAEVSVTQFLSRLKATGFALSYSQAAGENSVKVLTMHASKGLEYPVVILAGTDVQFLGEREQNEIMWTERFLAAPRSYDREKKLSYTTMVRRASVLCAKAAERKEGRNLLYVGMTRAKYRLHVVFHKVRKPCPPALASCMSDFIDFAACADLFCESRGEAAPAPARRSFARQPDEGIVKSVLAVYQKPYPFEASTRLRVKSSATYLLREQKGEFLQKVRAGEGFIDEDEPFDGDTSKEAGIAYHAFLQHVRFGCPPAEEAARMVREGELTAQQAALLQEERLRAILALPCLAGLAQKKVLREQKFLMRLPACEVAEGAPSDEVIFQGAIDLLIEEDGFEVVDYKYSVLSDAALREKYAVQIAIYKKAVARVMKVREEDVRAKIVNIARLREIAM